MYYDGINRLWLIHMQISEIRRLRIIMNYSLHDVNCISTSDSISLYWNKEEDIPEDSLYGLFMDGNLVGTTKKTHYTFEHLK